MEHSDKSFKELVENVISFGELQPLVGLLAQAAERKDPQSIFKLQKAIKKLKPKKFDSKNKDSLGNFIKKLSQLARKFL